MIQDISLAKNETFNLYQVKSFCSIYIKSGVHTWLLSISWYLSLSIGWLNIMFSSMASFWIYVDWETYIFLLLTLTCTNTTALPYLSSLNKIGSNKIEQLVFFSFFRSNSIGIFTRVMEHLHLIMNMDETCRIWMPNYFLFMYSSTFSSKIPFIFHKCVNCNGLGNRNNTTMINHTIMSFVVYSSISYFLIKYFMYNC